MVEKGARAPDFTLPSDRDGDITLSDLRGRRVVLYFYPKDNTSGCTAQACELRDELPRFEAGDAVVLGVSPDSVVSHARFREKHGLNFPLLADEDHRVAEAYGVWKEKSMYGRKYMGIERATYLIDGKGVIRGVWRKVKVAGHVDEILKAVKALD